MNTNAIALSPTHEPPKPTALASVSGSPAPQCRWIGLGEMCGEPATHKVKSVKYKHEMTVCECHADNFRMPAFEVTKLENGEPSGTPIDKKL